MGVDKASWEAGLLSIEIRDGRIPKLMKTLFVLLYTLYFNFFYSFNVFNAFSTIDIINNDYYYNFIMSIS